MIDQSIVEKTCYDMFMAMNGMKFKRWQRRNFGNVLRPANDVELREYNTRALLFLTQNERLQEVKDMINHYTLSAKIQGGDER